MRWCFRLFVAFALVGVLVGALVGTLAGGKAAWAAGPAEALPQPTGEVLLTVGGAIGRGNAQDAGGHRIAAFDRAMLERLGLHRVETATPWHSGKVRFEGTLLRDVLTAVQADGTSLHAVALNDYVIDIPVSDAERYDVILALKANGDWLTLRSKGPVFVVYPYDSDPALRRDVIYYRSIWQLRRIDIR
ncbi:MAG TPA: molybdopterin-dependent oxidoreductase [Ferrovibrio sp.]|uniref:molybdopterin-dependent oxidoreductase n=1 Tax=Ferrovibrio sp. TaxID=1917215 RepID=UPI002ED31119